MEPSWRSRSSLTADGTHSEPRSSNGRLTASDLLERRLADHLTVSSALSDTRRRCFEAGFAATPACIRSFSTAERVAGSGM